MTPNDIAAQIPVINKLPYEGFYGSVIKPGGVLISSARSVTNGTSTAYTVPINKEAWFYYAGLCLRCQTANGDGRLRVYDNLAVQWIQVYYLRGYTGNVFNNNDPINPPIIMPTGYYIAVTSSAVGVNATCVWQVYEYDV